jgi:2-dehydro-3-deoxyphosphogluconate aldolase/(4S)-4-hydroxy-2-oxoglutarate aldolase
MKLFPVEPLGGIGYLRAIAAPYHKIRFVPTGGVNASNLADYLTLSSVLACGGSWVAPEALVETGDWDGVHELAVEAVAIARAARQRSDPERKRRS